MPGSTQSTRPWQPKRCSMLSWVFRHRERLMLVYGHVQPPPLVGARFAPLEEPAAASPSERVPGQIVRRQRWTLLVPMPPVSGTFYDLHDFADS